MASGMRARWRFSRMGLLALLIGGMGGLPAQGFALGLGEIELDSALNERLSADVPLVDVGGLQPEEIRVSLASPEDFERVGVERFFYLSDLQFQVDVSRSGGGVIRVVSSKPITEPFLNFLVQVQWPQGRLLKEYTLLLDPPTYSQAAAPAVSPVVQTAPASATGGTSAQLPAREPRAFAGAAPTGSVQGPGGGGSVPAARASSERLVGDQYGMTDQTDTLWRIASRARPAPGLTVQQTMLAIQRLNPDAFLDGNINRLKAGVTLKLPAEDEVRKITAAEALEQVALQDRSWRGGGTETADAKAPAPVTDVSAAGRAAIDATPDSDASAPESASSEGQLRIVAGQGGSATGGAEPAAVPVDQAALAAAQEERDRLNMEVSDLTGQLTREKELAANQLQVKDRQLEVKDRQIAEIQAELARLRDSAVAPAAADEKQDQSAPAHAATPAAAWWQSPAVLGGGAGVVVLLLAGGLLAARRRRSDAGTELPIIATAVRGDADARPERPSARTAKAASAAVEPTASAAPLADLQPAVGAVVVGAAAAAPMALAAAAPASVPVGEVPGAELVDVIGEADIYIAYGRYGQASALLQTVLGDDPDRHDVRLKLLEIYAETGDRDGFHSVRDELGKRTSDPEILAAADALGGSMALSSTAPASQPGRDDAEAIAAPAPSPAEFDEFELDIPGAPSYDSTTGIADVIEIAEPAVEAESFDLQFAEVAADQPANEEAPIFDEPAAEGTEIEFDLDIDEAGEQSSSGPVLDQALLSPQGVLPGGDRGIDFRLEADDLEALDEAELALEMDGPTAADDEFDFVDDDDSAGTKLNLARAYHEMGDPEGAREILLEVLKEGTPAQQHAAQELLQRL